MEIQEDMMSDISQTITEGNRTIKELTNTELDYTYWQSNSGWFLGYLNIWPDHLTQGRDLPELEEMLADLYEFYKEENAINVQKKIGRLKLAV